MRRSKAFSLIELLVVIGIIAVLIAVLLPSLSRAREEAARITCQSNMRTIMAACIMYGAQNNDFIPFCNWDSTQTNNSGTAGWDATTFYAYGWLFQTQTGAGGQPVRSEFPPNGDLDGAWGADPPLDGMKTGVLWPFIEQAQVYHCPLDLDSGAYIGTRYMSSYLMNGSEAAFGDTTQVAPPGYRFGQINQPAQRVLLLEGFENDSTGAPSSNSNWNDGASNPYQETITDRHANGINVAYLDGHVDWMDGKSWNYFAQSGQAVSYGTAPADQPNLLYWNPGTANGH